MKLPLKSIAALAILAVSGGVALGADIAVMTGGAPKEALATLTPAFEKATGHKVTFTYAVIGAIQQKLAAGEKVDAVLMPAHVIETLVKAGTLRADHRALLGRVAIGVVVRAGAPKPDVSTAENFRKALLNARSIVHSTPGVTPSGTHIGRVLDQLGIAEAVRAKTIHRPSLEGGVELVARGEAEIGLFITSEVVHVKGVALVGYLPQPLQMEIVYAAAVPAANAAPEPAIAFVKFLSDPANGKRWQDAGFDPPSGS